MWSTSALRGTTPPADSVVCGLRATSAGSAAAGSLAGLDARHLRVVVAGLVVELGVDVDDVVVERLHPAADEDVVQRLRVALEDIVVPLVDRQRLDQVEERTARGEGGERLR